MINAERDAEFTSFFVNRKSLLHQSRLTHNNSLPKQLPVVTRHQVVVDHDHHGLPELNQVHQDRRIRRIFDTFFTFFKTGIIFFFQTGRFSPGVKVSFPFSINKYVSKFYPYVAPTNHSNIALMMYLKPT